MSTRTWNAGGMFGWRCDKNRIPWMQGCVSRDEDQVKKTVLDTELDAFDQYTAPVLEKCDRIRAVVQDALLELDTGLTAKPSLLWENKVTVPQMAYSLHLIKSASSEDLDLLESNSSISESSVGPHSSSTDDEASDKSRPLLSEDAFKHLTDMLSERKLTASRRNAREIVVTNGCEAIVLTNKARKDDIPAVIPSQVRRVSKIIIHTLWQSSLLSSEGLTASSVVCLVSCTYWERKKNPCLGKKAGKGGKKPKGEDAHSGDGVLLYAVLRCFGETFDIEKSAVTPRGIVGRAAGDKAAVQIFNTDPKDGDAVNMTAECTHWLRVRNLFLHCSAALEKWDGPSTLQVGSGNVPSGKSPLASITAFNKLATAYFQPPPTYVTPAQVTTLIGGSKISSNANSAASTPAMKPVQPPRTQHAATPLQNRRPQQQQQQHQSLMSGTVLQQMQLTSSLMTAFNDFRAFEPSLHLAPMATLVYNPMLLQSAFPQVHASPASIPAMSAMSYYLSVAISGDTDSGSDSDTDSTSDATSDDSDSCAEEDFPPPLLEE